MGLALLCALPLACAQRTKLNFDADWRFLLGDPRMPTCNATAFAPLNGLQCLGFSDLPAAASAPACAAACCALRGCNTWTWNPSAGCWASGDQCSSFLNNSGWVGGARTDPSPNPICAPTDPCAVAYDDASWRSLRVPHDYGVEAAFDPALPAGKGALPKNTSWYRKTFTVPQAAQGSLIYLTFDGVFRAADVFLNGAFLLHHEEGYTSWTAWLHNASAPLLYGAPNVLAVFVDGTSPELWSYEGMGILRHVYLETAPQLSIVPWSFFAPALVTGNISGTATTPQTADGAVLTPRVDLANAGSAHATGTVLFSLRDATGAEVCNGSSARFDLPPGGWARLPASLPCGSSTAPVNLWNTARGGAYLYTATAQVVLDGGALGDAASARIGLRSALFSPTQGFVLNGQKIVLRGFSNHVGFGGCGGAVPDRVVEFMLAAQLQGMGGNAYRTAHNPVAPELLDFADEYGILVWEENRFITAGVQPQNRRGRALAEAGVAPAPAPAGAPQAATGSSPPAPPPSVPLADPRLLQDAQDMVLRDRNHPSVFIWCACAP